MPLFIEFSFILFYKKHAVHFSTNMNSSDRQIFEPIKSKGSTTSSGECHPPVKALPCNHCSTAERKGGSLGLIHVHKFETT